jgi:hypothetical protein
VTRTTILALFLAVTAPTLSAQTVESGFDWLSCADFGGLHGFSENCGANTDFYVYVFTGTVLSIQNAPDSEQRLKIAPEEVFHGNPPSTVTVFTNQRRCLPEIRIGDKWLFYIYKSHENRLIVSYGHINAPVADSAEHLALLRRLAQMHDTGLIRGHVQRSEMYEDDKAETSAPVAGHKITAARIPHRSAYQTKAESKEQTGGQGEDRTEYTAITDAEGNYEFKPLPLGTYEIRGNTDGTAWSESGDVEIKPGSCYYIGFAMRNGATISGRVLLPDDKRDTPLWVKAVLASDPDDAPESDHEVVPASIFVRDGSHYQLKALRPGRYLIAAELPNPADPKKPLRIYYPGVTSADRAVIIEVGKTDTRTNVDFEIPRP